MTLWLWDRGGCYPPQPITPSEICLILHILRKPKSLSCFDVKFIFDSVSLGLSSSANNLQIADVALRFEGMRTAISSGQWPFSSPDPVVSWSRGLETRGSGRAPQNNVFEGAIQYFAGQRHRLLKFKTPVTLNWFSTRAR